MEERAKEREEAWKKKQNQKFHCESCLCFGQLGLGKFPQNNFDGSNSESEPDGTSLHGDQSSSVFREVDSVLINIPSGESSHSAKKSGPWIVDCTHAF